MDCGGYKKIRVKRVGVGTEVFDARTNDNVITSKNRCYVCHGTEGERQFLLSANELLRHCTYNGGSKLRISDIGYERVTTVYYLPPVGEMLVAAQ